MPKTLVAVKPCKCDFLTLILIIIRYQHLKISIMLLNSGQLKQFSPFFTFGYKQNLKCKSPVTSHPQKHACKWTGNSKLPVDVNMCVCNIRIDVSSSLCVLPHTSWDRLCMSTKAKHFLMMNE